MTFSTVLSLFASLLEGSDRLDCSLSAGPDGGKQSRSSSDSEKQECSVLRDSLITLSPQLRRVRDRRESDISQHKAHRREQQSSCRTMCNLSRRWITGLHTSSLQEFCCCGFVFVLLCFPEEQTCVEWTSELYITFHCSGTDILNNK